MSSAKGSAAIQEMIARCRALADLPKQVAPLVAREMKSWVVTNIGAGVAPDGTAWPRKKDGSLALRGAANDISTQAVGTIAQMFLRAPAVFHHFGAQGKPIRLVIPKGAIPDKLGQAIRKGAILGWQAIVKRGKR